MNHSPWKSGAEKSTPTQACVAGVRSRGGMAGRPGAQRRFRIGDVGFRPRQWIGYVLELFADGAKPVVHVWQLAGG